MNDTMFNRYGGFGTVSKLVSAFYDRAMRSAIIGDYFKAADMRNLIRHQTKMIATVMGGPPSYSNDDLRRAHSGLSIDKPAFQEMVKLLTETLEDFQVAPDDIEEILKAVGDASPLVISR